MCVRLVGGGLRTGGEDARRGAFAATFARGQMRVRAADDGYDRHVEPTPYGIGAARWNLADPRAARAWFPRTPALTRVRMIRCPRGACVRTWRTHFLSWDRFSKQYRRKAIHGIFHLLTISSWISRFRKTYAPHNYRFYTVYTFVYVCASQFLTVLKD